ncbi:MAG: TIR domain-containing protein [Anaerolineae bacterium]|nr:TIR domain-containing protein [Anaerolineae bacterium]MDQ7033774.1 TIR domain-containing protein [Anaerolineae bacterium]
MPRIYISYRIEDANIVRQIVRRCLQTYGNYSVIANPQASLPPNIALKQHIDNLMFSTQSILLVIGPDWAGIDKYGRFKLSSADIPIGTEVRLALRSEKQVILVLVNGAQLPYADSVPDDLQAIFQLPIARLRDKIFQQDLNQLIPPPSLSNKLLYYFSLAWTKNYIRFDDEAMY